MLDAQFLRGVLFVNFVNLNLQNIYIVYSV